MSLSPKKYNDLLFWAFLKITGKNVADKGNNRIKYPRLIRYKYPDLRIVAKAIQWGWNLHNKDYSVWYWREGRLTLEKLYYKVIPSYIEFKKNEEEKEKNRNWLSIQKQKLFNI